MTMSILRKRVTITPEEYLQGELYSDIRHEYVNGAVHAMVGASEAHNLIAGNWHSALHRHLRGTACRVFISDMKVRVGDIFYYPDVLVSCSGKDAAPYYKTEPVLIIEVSSPSTEIKDSLEKRIAYQSLASLQEYVLANQDEQEVKIYRRAENGWDLETFADGEQVRLASVDLAVPMEAVYENAWR
jgi:Uma2 family endonuclease